MCAKWNQHSNDSGILRKNDHGDKKQELLVFGYACKLYRDDEKALYIDQGKHLIPWMGDETLKIDRYDARGALHDLSSLEPPPGGHDWRIELTEAERRVELLVNEERYRALHCDEDEEEMYKEEELKRLHAAGYGQVGFNYEAETAAKTEPQPEQETDEPFVPSQELKDLMPQDVVMPEGQKQNAIIEKTAKFIADQGNQMEILIKAKQADNAQFKFLEKDNSLHPYYQALLKAFRSGDWPPKPKVTEVQQEQEEYLHPTLATPIESAPSIPSIQYRPSADCDYTLLVSRLRGPPQEWPAPGELPPPGTEPLTLPLAQPPPPPPPPQPLIAKGPVMYNDTGKPADQEATLAYYQKYAAYYQQYYGQAPPEAGHVAQPVEQPVAQPVATQVVQKPANSAPDAAIQSTGLNLMSCYNSGSETDNSGDEDEGPARQAGSSSGGGGSAEQLKQTFKAVRPPEHVQLVVRKMAAYVARNGDEFEEIVRAKGDPRFQFLEPSHQYHPFYRSLMKELRAEQNGEEESGAERSGDRAEDKKPVVSFSIKKLKEPEPVLPKPALPYESSSDEEEDGKVQSKESTPSREVQKTQAIANMQPAIPQAVIYRIDPTQTAPAQPNVTKVSENVDSKPENNIEIKKPAEHNKYKYVPEYKTNAKLERRHSTEAESKRANDSVAEKRLSPELCKRIRSEDREIKNKSSPSLDKRKHSPEKDKKRKHSPDKDKRRKGSPEMVKRSKDSPIVEKTSVDSLEKDTLQKDHSERVRSKDRSRKRHSRERQSKSRSQSHSREVKRPKKKNSSSEDSSNPEEEIITIGDKSDEEFIDLTGDLSDGKGEGETEMDKSKQLERKRRAAEFLAKMARPGSKAPVLPRNTLASAMAQTINQLQKKEKDVERSHRKKMKRKHRGENDEHGAHKSHSKKKKRRKHGSPSEKRHQNYEDGGDRHDSSHSKRKKYKKDKKHKKSKKQRRREHEDEPDPARGGEGEGAPVDRLAERKYEDVVKEKLRRKMVAEAQEVDVLQQVLEAVGGARAPSEERAVALDVKVQVRPQELRELSEGEVTTESDSSTSDTDDDQEDTDDKAD